MIFSSINLNYNNKNYSKAIITALDFLKNTDFSTIEDGIYDIQGKDVYAQIFHKTTHLIQDTRAETHEKYVDLQYLIDGQELIGVSILSENYVVDEIIKERDLIFYKGEDNETFIKMKPGLFCVFFIDDVHRPAVAVKDPINIRKAVIKINSELL